MKAIEAACHAIWAGARLYVASDVPFFATKQGRTMGYSYAIVGAIRRVTRAPMILTGKPSLHALRFVARRLGLRRRDFGIVGDDPSVEIIMARRGGAKAFAVTTGVTAREEWERQTGLRRPDQVLRRLGDLLESLSPVPSGIRARCDAVTTIREGDLLWTPSKARRESLAGAAFHAVARKSIEDFSLESYDALWRWSVTDLESFWHSIWDYFGVQASAPFDQSAWAAEHAGSGVVPGRAAQLCGLYSRARASRGDGHHQRARGRAAAADELGHARRPGAHPGDATAPNGRSARRSRRGGVAQCTAGGDRNAGNHQHWRHLELLRPGLRHQGRVGALQATGTQGIFLRRCLPVRR